MKRFVCFCMIMILLVSMTGCSKASGANKAFDTAMESMKNGESLDTQLDSLLSGILSENKTELKSKLSQLVNDAKYKVNSVTEREDGTVALKVQVTTIDASAVMNQFILEMTNLVSSADYQAKLESMSKEEYHSILVTSMLTSLEGKLPATEQELEVIMVKEKTGWRMEDESVITQALFSNLAAAVTSLV